MADDKSSAGTGAGPGSAPGSGLGSGKRPYATLDLKATEVNVTPAKGSSASSTSSATDAEVPRPAAAKSYAVGSGDANEPLSEVRVQSELSKNEKPKTASSASSSSASAANAANDDAKVVIQKRGGFFSHLAAGVVGGILALSGYQWALPQLGLQGSTDAATALSQRLAAVEKSQSVSPSPTPDLTGIEARISDLENATKKIPAITESQARLVAETKAALASAASDAGSPQLIERISKVEDRLKALAEAGVNDPNANRIEQLAALTGKVSDLETSLATQLTALRQSVAKDVDGRVQAAAEAAEAARAGTQRIDKDVAGLKTDNVRSEEEIGAVKAATDHLAADLKLAQEETQNLKTAFDGLKTAAAKPADIAAAVQPLSDRTAALEKSVQNVVQGDAARKESSERVVLALELQTLRRALDSGQNFSAQLADVKKIAGNKIDLSALEKLQETGVPSLADLSKDFHMAADSAIEADSEPDNASVVDRLWAGAKSIVRVRRIDFKADDKSTEAIVGRMQVALNDGRLPDVLEAAKDLSPRAQDAARPFLDKVAARVSVDSALANLESQLKSSIATGSQQPAKPLP